MNPIVPQDFIPGKLPGSPSHYRKTSGDASYDENLSRPRPYEVTRMTMYRPSQFCFRESLLNANLVVS